VDHLKKHVSALTLVDCLKFGLFDSALVFGIYPARLGSVGLGWSNKGVHTFRFTV
jgi:hypothetical protein